MNKASRKWLGFECLESRRMLAPVQWVNGNWYDFIPAAITWHAAREAANASMFVTPDGETLLGHLANITSAGENAFLSRHFLRDGDNQEFAWFGGWEPGDDGIWQWSDGPEAGQQFGFEAWGGIEPNDQKPDEDFAMYNVGHYFAGIFPAHWADAAPTPSSFDPVIGYFVEFEGNDNLCGVPDLTPIAELENEYPPPTPGMALEFEALGGTIADRDHLTPELRTALESFEDVLRNAGVSFEFASGFRPTAYQAHLYELSNRFKSLEDIPGITAENQTLRIDSDDLDAMACDSLVSDINDEVARHGLTDVRYGVAEHGRSLHERGEAIDISIDRRLSVSEIDELASRAFPPLWRSYASRDHFVLHPTPGVVGGTFTGNSPINLLVVAPDGRRIGFDLMLGTAVNDFGPSAYYSGPGTEPQVITLPFGDMSLDEYTVQGISTGNGPYSIDLKVVGADGVVFNGTIGGGFAVDNDHIQQLTVDVSTYASTFPGDATLDGRVDSADFNAWFENRFTDNNLWARGDFNTDGVVDVSDFNIWNANKFIVSPPAAAPFPVRSPRAPSQQAIPIAVASPAFVLPFRPSAVVEFEIVTSGIEQEIATPPRPDVQDVRRVPWSGRADTLVRRGHSSERIDLACEQLFARQDSAGDYTVRGATVR